MADSNATQAACDYSWLKNEASKAIQITITLLIFVVGISLNGLVVWVLGLRGRRHLVRRGSTEETRAANSFRVYVLHLALADLILLLRTPLMIGYLINDYSWPFGKAVCHLIIFLRCLGLYMSAFLVCAVALERCLCLLRPVWARLKRPAWAVPLVCGVLWLMALVLSVPYIYFADLKDVNGTKQCVEGGRSNLGLILTDTIAGFILPLMVFLGSNAAVLLTINKALPSTPSGTTPSMARKMSRMYHVLFSTMLLFLTCWVPFFVCRFLMAVTHSSCSATQCTYISLYLVYIKCTLNPVMYVFAARGLGRAIKASLISTIDRLFNDESYESIRRKSLKNSQM